MAARRKDHFDGLMDGVGLVDAKDAGTLAGKGLGGGPANA
jgi:hypothetical protein